MQRKKVRKQFPPHGRYYIRWEEQRIAAAIAKRLLGRFQTFTCPRCWREYEDSLDDLRCSLDAQQSYGNTGFCCEPCKEDHGN